MNQVKDKWRNREYLDSVAGCVDSIVAGRAVIEHVDLSGIVIGPGAVLNELKAVNLFESEIRGVDLSGSKISGSLSDSVFVGVNFERASLDRALMCNVEMKGCDFSKSTLVINMDDAVCEDTAFFRARFLGGGSGVEYGGRRVTFVGCDFTEAVFDRVEFRASKFIDCTFTGAVFKRCDFRGVKFQGGTLPLAHQFESMDVPDVGLR